MPTTVVAANLSEGLGIPDVSKRITGALLATEADVISLTDASWVGNPIHGARDDISDYCT